MVSPGERFHGGSRSGLQRQLSRTSSVDSKTSCVRERTPETTLLSEICGVIISLDKFSKVKLKIRIIVYLVYVYICLSRYTSLFIPFETYYPNISKSPNRERKLRGLGSLGLGRSYEGGR